MPSRPVLAAVTGLLLLTAGCLGSPSGSPTAETPAQAAPEPPPEEMVTLPGGPKERPDWPAMLNESSVRNYVQAYEYNYVYNNLYQGEYTEMSLECDVEEVTPSSSEYEVVATCTGSSTTDPPADSTATPGVHADWFTQSFRYRVSGDGVGRTSVE